MWDGVNYWPGFAEPVHFGSFNDDQVKGIFRMSDPWWTILLDLPSIKVRTYQSRSRRKRCYQIFVCSTKP